ncbi:hypothetical protein [Streptomyces sp. NPDC026589]|uniref:hypothetical protein n=1 Tax=Streptomyces sp. NPDC026589 TaxID=3155609 RepID=UPI0033CDA377
MDDVTETPEADDQVTSGPDEARRRRTVLRKHLSGAMRAGKDLLKEEAFRAAVFAGTMALLEALANRRGTEEGVDVLPDTVSEEFGSSPAPVAESQPRQSPVLHPVVGSLVKLSPGEQASEENKAKYKADTGNDLPPGCKYRPPHSRGGSSQDQDPGQAAA